jgi:hypothetical protein
MDYTERDFQSQPAAIAREVTDAGALLPLAA